MERHPYFAGRGETALSVYPDIKITYPFTLEWINLSFCGWYQIQIQGIHHPNSKESHNKNIELWFT